LKPLLPIALSVATLAVAADRPVPLRSGVEFTGSDARMLQGDDIANPGMLWVTRGEALWSEPAGASGKSCADCHGDAAKSMKGIAARTVDLEGRVENCRTENQQARAFEPESQELLSLTAFVAYQSRGVPITLEETPQLQASLQRGRTLYHRRVGQMNLSCSQCHDDHWGRRLAAETISQGHPNAFPAYRMSWEAVGSLSRRIRACYSGVRAEMPEYGSPDLKDLQAYLAWRATGLPVEAPGVRR
jgi:sulfur-oxidizing protein SoxA